MNTDLMKLAAPGADPNQVHTQFSPGKILCNLPNVVGAVCQLKDFGEKAAGTAVNSALDGFVDSLGHGLAKIVRMSMTWWVNLPSPQLASSTGEPGPVLASIREYTNGLQVLLMIAGILFAAARLAMAKRGGVAGEAQESFLIFARAVFASMLFSALITTGTKAGDAFSNWVIFDATRGDLDGAVSKLVDFDLRNDSGLGTGVLLLLWLLGLISMLVQLVMLVIRQAVLILVVAAIPLAAAAGGTGPGSQAYKRMLSWALAFVLWKPVGALVYAIAFTAAGSSNGGQQDPQLALLGLLLLLSVAIVLPALMRLIAPAVSTLGGGEERLRRWRVARSVWPWGRSAGGQAGARSAKGRTALVADDRRMTIRRLHLLQAVVGVRCPVAVVPAPVVAGDPRAHPAAEAEVEAVEAVVVLRLRRAGKPVVRPHPVVPPPRQDLPAWR